MTSMPSPAMTFMSPNLSSNADYHGNTMQRIDYDYDSEPPYIPGASIPPHSCITQASCVIAVVLYFIIFLLGLLGNGVVIWVVAYKMTQKTVNTTWYLSLALSDFIYCATLPFNIALSAMDYWIFGPFLCKFISFVLFLNMFSSIFLMVVISADRLVVVVWAIWAQNNRTLKKAAFMVVVAWLLAALLSIPALVVRDVAYDDPARPQCYNEFSLLHSNSATVLPVFRFVLGFLFPLAAIAGCYGVIVLKLRNNKLAKSAKPFKIMTALVVTFVVSWLPYHVFVLLEIELGHDKSITTRTTMAAILASANSCMNPFLYAFMGKDVKKKLCSSLVPNIENAFMEEKSKSTSVSQAYSTAHV